MALIETFNKGKYKDANLPGWQWNREVQMDHRLLKADDESYRCRFHAALWLVVSLTWLPL